MPEPKTKYPDPYDLLVPIDEIIRDVESGIIDYEWNDDVDKAEVAREYLEHLKDERERGCIYYPLF